MKKSLFTVLLILFIEAVSFAQTEPTCPNISIIEPEFAVVPGGEDVVYSVSIPEKLSKRALKYIWKVNQGEIVRGQGTSSIVVSTEGLEDTTIIATVNISGLPAACKNMFSGSGLVSAGLITGSPRDQFGELTDFDLIARLDPLASDLMADPTSTALIENYGPEIRVAERESLIAFYLNTERQIDSSRLAFARSTPEPNIRTVLWVVPEGAKDLDCEGCANKINGRDIKFDAEEISSKLDWKSCPSISVWEPAVAVLPGESQTFTAYVTGEVDLGKIGYKWTVANGKIIKGQGTPTLSVIAEEQGSYTFATATVEITGLPDKCVCTTASGSSLMSYDRPPVLRNEFGVLSKSELRIRLEPYVQELLADPNATGFVVIYGKADDVKKREKFIQEFMIKRGDIEASRIVFVYRGKEKTIRTRLWIVFAGGDPSVVD